MTLLTRSSLRDSPHGGEESNTVRSIPGRELGLPPDPADGEYEAISMGSSDALIAMKAGQLAAFTC